MRLEFKKDGHVVASVDALMLLQLMAYHNSGPTKLTLDNGLLEVLAITPYLTLAYHYDLAAVAAMGIDDDIE